MLLYSGHETEHNRGVGILLSKSIRDSLLEWEPISDRIIRARLSVKYGKFHIIECYASTEDKDLSVKETFYSQLDQTLAKIPKQDMVVLMGDFNAKVGSSNDNAEHVMGKHGLGTRNENSELLIDVCSSHNLVIGGTLFPHKDCHKITWNSPNRRDRNQIDHICISYDTTMEGRWRQIKDSILSTCDTELGTSKKKSEEYIQESTWKTIDQRKEVYVKLLSATELNAGELCQQYSALDRTVKREVRSDWRRLLIVET